MSVTIGSKLGSHEIMALLGRGGMGEVYRARDTKLKREVAIKILPDEFSRDPDRLSRFQREAEVLASLNHQNIAAIYDLEEANGSRFLVLELVDGETLAERIKRGPIPIDEVLNIAKYVCEALEAAHEKGVVHRDLKPANVKITPEGIVKVLDFGLAKAMENAPTNMTLSNSPTLSLAATNAGVILGTAAYMSPEQAKGKTVDRRADIWAFGVVVYEMLTGRRLFFGETTSETMAAVMMKEPDWTALPANTPARLRELLRRCLIKEPRSRLRDIGEARIAVEETVHGSEICDHPLPAASRGRKQIAWLSLLVLLALTAVALGVRAFRPVPTTPPLPEMRVDIITPATTDPLSFALSPDGRQIAFVASGDGLSRLWLRSLDKVTAQPLAGTEGASRPFWSPDSRSIGFFAGPKLMRIDLAGGSPQTLADAYNRGGAWSPDGVILFQQTVNGPLFRVPASGGTAVVVTKLDKQSLHSFPQFLPDGRQFLFYAGPPASGIYLGSLDAPQTKRLVASEAAGLYAPAGWLLFIRAGTLAAQRLDLVRQELTGDPVTVADRVAFTGGSSAVSVSAAGLVAYRTGGTNERQLVWFDRSGKELGTMGVPDENGLYTPRLSPDGRRVAVRRSVQNNPDIWLMDDTRTTRFTFDAGVDRDPIWSPDGNRIAFASDRKGVHNLYQKPSNGAGSEELMVESAQTKVPFDWSADGRFIIYSSTDPQTSYDLWVLPLEGDRKPFVFLKTSFDERRGQFSPDVHWVAYMSNESGRHEIYVRPFPGPGGQWQVSTAGGISPRWAPSGKELYYIAPDGTLMAAPIAVNGATIAPGRPVALFHPRMFGGGIDNGVGTNYDVTRDGRFLINTIVDTAASPITLIQNWHGGLAARENR